MTINTANRQIQFQDPYAKVRNTLRDRNPLLNPPPPPQFMRVQSASTSDSVARLAAKSTESAAKLPFHNTGGVETPGKDAQDLGNAVIGGTLGYFEVAYELGKSLGTGFQDTKGLEDSSRDFGKDILTVPLAYFELAASIGRSLGESAKGSIETAADFVEDVAETAEDVVDAAVDAAEDTTEEVVDTVTDIWNDIWN